MSTMHCSTSAFCKRPIIRLTDFRSDAQAQYRQTVHKVGRGKWSNTVQVNSYHSIQDMVDNPFELHKLKTELKAQLTDLA